jgi:hypothetical protein
MPEIFSGIFIYGANMKLKELIKPSEFDEKAKGELKLLSVYDKANLFIGAKKEVEPKTVVVKSTGDGKVYGRRTIYTK